MISQLKTAVVPGADGKSVVEKQAAAAAKDRRVTDLQKLVNETELALERGTTIIEQRPEPPGTGPGPGEALRR